MINKKRNTKEEKVFNILITILGSLTAISGLVILAVAVLSI